MKKLKKLNRSQKELLNKLNIDTEDYLVERNTGNYSILQSEN